MLDILLRTAPLALLFGAGVALARHGVLGARGCDRMLALVVNVGLPALVLGTFSVVELTRALAWLPVAAAATLLLTLPLSWAAARAMALPSAGAGVMLIGPSILNMAVEYPYVMAAWGEQGIARLVLFDLGNGVVVLTLVYAIACACGGRTAGAGEVASRLMRFPPLWALVAAAMLNGFGVAVPDLLLQALQALGGALVLLVLVALGVHFDARAFMGGRVVAVVALRLVPGAVLGFAWVALFDLEGLERAVVLVGTLAPVGFNTLVFAARENLDRSLAASAVSASLLLALVYLPLLMALLS